MNLLPMFPELLRQLFREPATNRFPAKYLPGSVTMFFRKIAAGEASMVPAVNTPPKFRGKIDYQRDGCIGCKLCTKICPSNAIQFLEDTKRIRIWVDQCIFCSQCTDICPKGGLFMTDQFLLADEDRYSENLIVE